MFEAITLIVVVAIMTNIWIDGRKKEDIRKRVYSVEERIDEINERVGELEADQALRESTPKEDCE